MRLTVGVTKGDEIQQMQRLLADCLDTGAVGMSTSFVDMDENLAPVPSRFATVEELDALCATLGERGKILQVVHVGGSEAFEQAPGGFYDKDLAQKLVENLFTVRNAVDPEVAYRAFRGRDAGIDAVMRSYGFPVPD